MNIDKQHKTAPVPGRDTETLAALLLELEDALSETKTGERATELTLKWHTQTAAIQARLSRMSALHAPWLDLGRSRLRWLVFPLNLLILPWGRKQAAFNADVQQTLLALTRMTNDTLLTADAVTRLESRLTRLESLIRNLLAHKPTTRGAVQNRVDNF